MSLSGHSNLPVTADSICFFFVTGLNHRDAGLFRPMHLQRSWRKVSDGNPACAANEPRRRGGFFQIDRSRFVIHSKLMPGIPRAVKKSGRMWDRAKSRVAHAGNVEIAMSTSHARYHHESILYRFHVSGRPSRIAQCNWAFHVREGDALAFNPAQ